MMVENITGQEIQNLNVIIRNGEKLLLLRISLKECVASHN